MKRESHIHKKETRNTRTRRTWLKMEIQKEISKIKRIKNKEKKELVFEKKS